MGYLGLDLSLSSTGFFLLREDGTNKNFSIVTKPDQYTCLVKRAKAIAEKIIREIKDEDVSLVLMEDFFVGQHAHAVIGLAALGTMVRDRLSAAGYRYVTAEPSQIKKYETGKGTAKKDVMVKYVYKNHDFDTNCNDIADACAMAYLCKGYVEYLKGGRDFFKYQLQVLKIMHQIEEPYSD
ncbi:MAG: crossover junction endodeoxyribonuclease RuvC [Clostridia bacterium]|nr:crossover junction endodeoxyribonuclease RuvC [Clostridia bacterium]